MRCPYCNDEDTQVKDSRPTEDNSVIRRRRSCTQCGARFTTFERVQLRDLMVKKRDGKKMEFDRDKLARSIMIAFRKRPLEDERIEKMITGLVRRLESSGDSEIESSDIGELVMNTLSEIDQVAYVRFASVYRNFREARDFEKFIGGLSEDTTKK